MAARLPHVPADTRNRLIEAARYLFWEKGYAATGLSEILARAGANSGSFYHFFDSKDAVLREVLQTYEQLLEPFVLRPVWEQQSDPIGRVFLLLAGYRDRLAGTACQYGCPIGRLALELDPDNAPAHALIARNFTAWRQAVEGCVRAAGLPKPDEVAAFVLTVMEGAVMQSRAYRSLDPYDACVRQLRLYFDGLADTHGTRRPVRSRRSTKQRSRKH